MSETTRKADAADFAGLPDEALVSLAQKQCNGAEQTLLLRYLDVSYRLIAKLGCRFGLAREDIQEAQQEAVFFLQTKAITAYKRIRQTGRGICRFKSFRYRVLLARFYNLVRGLQRRAAHYPHGPNAMNVVGSPRGG